MHTNKGNTMSILDAKAINFSAAERRDTLTNVVASCIVKIPPKSGWWHMIPIHRKGSIFKSDILFSHFGTVLGLPDYATSESFCETQVMKKGKRGHYENTDLWSMFKSNNDFSNTNI